MFRIYRQSSTDSLIWHSSKKKVFQSRYRIFWYPYNNSWPSSTKVSKGWKTSDQKKRRSIPSISIQHFNMCIYPMGKPPDVQYFVRRNAYFKPSVRNFEFKVNKIYHVNCKQNHIIIISLNFIQFERFCIKSIITKVHFITNECSLNFNVSGFTQDNSWRLCMMWESLVGVDISVTLLNFPTSF